MSPVVELSRDQRMPVGHLEATWHAVVLPVGDAVANHHALDWRLESTGILHVDLVMVMDRVQEVWDVNARIRLS